MKITSFKTIEKAVKPYRIYNLYHFKPIKGFCLDSRFLKEGEVFIALAGKYKDGHDFGQEAAKRGASLIISSRYLKEAAGTTQFIVEDTYEALEKIIIFLRRKHKKAKFLAITGSLGKTTTKEMLGFMLSPYKKVLKNKNTENNILGVAKTLFSYDNHDLVIFELGTNQKGEIPVLAKAVKPDIGVITCIKPVHLEGLESLEGVKKEKLSLFKNNPRCKAVLNKQDPLLATAKIKNKIYWFAKNKKADLYCRLQKRENQKVYFKVLGKYNLILPLYFEYFIDNCLAALLGAHLLGLPYKDLIFRLNCFNSYPSMRMEKKEIKNYIILNDAYNASPDSFKKALLTLNHFNLPKVVVAADMLELGARSGYYHRRLASQIIDSNIEYCLTYGNQAEITCKQLKALGHKKAFHFSTQRQLGSFLKRKLKNKKYLILLKGSRKMKLESIFKFL